MVSRSSENGFVQIIQIGPSPGILAGPVPEPPLPAQESTAPPPLPATAAPAGTPIGITLETLGMAPLDDLDFPSGSSDLVPGAYASLAELATYLRANPARSVALVGHTDASGALEVNITLSRRRAASVLDRLLSLGVPRAQMTAQGVGPLAPRQANLTPEGRAQNRRVEVVLTSTR